jgi:hypothetical protein
MFLLYRLVGPASLVGLGVMIAVMPVNASILLHLRKLQEGNMKSKDQRVRQVRPWMRARGEKPPSARSLRAHMPPGIAESRTHFTS